MFFIKDLEQTILLHPSYFGPDLADHIGQKLHEDVEGTCNGRFGYIISVLTIRDIGVGKILPGSGQAEFRASYSAIVMKPYKGEVVQGIVNSVSKMGIFLDVGPLSVFVSSHHLPPDMRFEPSSNPPSYVTDDESVTKGVSLRVKLIGTRVDANEIFAIGSIKDDWLGLV